MASKAAAFQGSKMADHMIPIPPASSSSFMRVADCTAANLKERERVCV